MNQHVQRLRPLPARSAPATLEYRWERFGAITRELAPLFKRHWQEIGVDREAVPLDPDWQQYLDYDLLGIARVLTVRSRGTLVGYAVVFVRHHLHYASTPWAQYDLYWLDPVYRQGWSGVKLFLEVERALRDWGVKVVTLGMKIHFDEESEGRMARLLKRLGYTPRDVVYTKVLA